MALDIDEARNATETASRDPEYWVARANEQAKIARERGQVPVPVAVHPGGYVGTSSPVIGTSSDGVVIHLMDYVDMPRVLEALLEAMRSGASVRVEM